MPSVPADILKALQTNQPHLRNICILAHVDHGKTTLSDSLICTNGIISQKLAGKVRFLDNLPAEQEKGITMKASCITLLYNSDPSKLSKETSYLVNLIDSPGHVDFSSEVSTAVRLSDGCLVLVDVVEGPCIQTQAVLRQAWNEKLKPCLVLNKVDRLIIELHLTPIEAYEQIRKVLEQVNVITATLFTEEWRKELNEKQEKLESNETIEWDINEQEEEQVYFSPERGNVLFSSAIDGWGFRIEQFCKLYEAKLGIKSQILRKTLWGEYYFNPKTKKIYNKNTSGKMVPMFAQFVLNNIWEVYNAVYQSDQPKIEKIVNSLKISILPKELHSQDPKTIIQAIFSKWLPLANATLEMIVQHVPSPVDSQKIRLPRLWKKTGGAQGELLQKQMELEALMSSCDPSPEKDVVAFVSKVSHNISPLAKAVVPRSRSEGPRPPTEIPTQHQGNKMIAFSRIFCGTIRRGQQVYVLGPKYNPLEPEKYCTSFVIDDLYILMGADVEPVERVPAGNVFGIGIVGETIIKTATLSTTPFCPSFHMMTFASSPIVRYALEPENPADMPKLIEGMRLLNQADPCVECFVQETGEHVVVASGELHFERCLRDLRESYAKIPIRVSPPIVSFRETITNEPACKSIFSPNFNTTPKDGIQTANKRGIIKVSAVALPENIRKFLEQNSSILRRLYVKESGDPAELDLFVEGLKSAFLEAGGKWIQEFDKIWAFGPKSCGPNILLNHIPDFSTCGNWISFVARLKTFNRSSRDKSAKVDNNLKPKETEKETEKGSKKEEEESEEEKEEDEEYHEIQGQDKENLLRELDNSIRSGFQVATNSGPLCEEPISGVCFIVEDIILQTGCQTHEDRGPFSGQVMSAVKEACRQAFLAHSARLIQPMFYCEIQVPPEHVGSVCSVLGRRKAKIVQEQIKDGTSMFSIEALLPVMESFGLSVELLTETSGTAHVQMIFHGWEVLDQDPYWVATTEEELEDVGENLGGLAPNLARQYVDSVRKRKGLPVMEKIVEHGDKQRTLKRNK